MDSHVIRAPTAPFPSVDSSGGNVSAAVTASGIHGHQPQSISFNLNVAPAPPPTTSTPSPTVFYAASPPTSINVAAALVSLGVELSSARQELQAAQLAYQIAFEHWSIEHSAYTGSIAQYQATLAASDRMNVTREAVRRAENVLEDVDRRILYAQTGPASSGPTYGYPPSASMGSNPPPPVAFINSPFTFQNQQQAGNTGTDWWGLFKKILNLVSCGKLFPGFTF
ncbi:hypothetical protein CALCODRAFT_509169 [Calocera cornea HHB12733]|uniref:Uncharacterized protein n=1 Tax=Calocera cornea HHB12733 TaxID=1353952 RepID=A0A165FJB9_9BASI|nr:hypothetical protein CALCODRAFT_509169 [Calocera cornea HHB12733]